MLRITPQPIRAGDLRLEGSLRAAEVATLLSEIVRVREAGAAVRLDGSGLTFVDGAGAECLRSLRASGIAVERLSAFVRSLVWPDDELEAERRST